VRNGVARQAPFRLDAREGGGDFPAHCVGCMLLVVNVEVGLDVLRVARCAVIAFALFSQTSFQFASTS